MARWFEDAMWFVLRNTKVLKLRKNYNMEVVFHDEEPEPPFILMANHSHEDDPYMIGGYMNHTVNYMANIDGVSDLQRYLSYLVGCYGKKKGAPDFKAVKHTIELLKSGNIVGIFPEGDRSWDGETVKFIPGSVALAKKYKVPIRLAKMTGNYLSKPRWADYPRKGKLQVDFYTISIDEIQAAEVSEMEERIWSILKHDDIKSPLNKDVVFKGENLASGIQRLLWLCPRCGEQDTLSGDGDSIVCSSCNSSWLLDGSMKISPEDVQGRDLKDWVVWQRKEMENLCDSNSENLLTETENIVLSEIIDRKMVHPCKGDLKLYADRVEFISDECETIVLKRELVLHYIDNFNKAFEFDYDKKRYRILFDGKNASKWIFFLDYLKGK
jgi:1-acyl-sn-glycerol-3-phosphate acyltransferase